MQQAFGNLLTDYFAARQLRNVVVLGLITLDSFFSINWRTSQIATIGCLDWTESASRVCDADFKLKGRGITRV